jgi:hypothetical protein
VHRHHPPAERAELRLADKHERHAVVAGIEPARIVEAKVNAEDAQLLCEKIGPSAFVCHRPKPSVFGCRDERQRVDRHIAVHKDAPA